MEAFRKLTSLFLAALLTLSALAVVPLTASAEVAVPTEETRNGVTAYYIDSADEFIALAKDIGMGTGNHAAYYSKTFIITTDLDMSGKTWPQAITFRGTLDGQGHTIKNLNLTSSGMFNNVSATFKNFAIVDCTVNAAHPAVIARDALASSTTTFENVYIGGTINAASGSLYAGTFIARMHDTGANHLIFKNCVSDVTITGATTSGTGGFLGLTYVNKTPTVTMTNCAFIGDLSEATSSAGVGGFVGNARCDVTLNQCVSMGLNNSEQTLSGALVSLGNPGTAKAFVTNNCFVGQNAVKAVSIPAANTNSTVNIDNGKYTLATGTTLSEKVNEIDAQFGKLDTETLTKAEWDKADSKYAVLKNNGWVMTGNTVEYAADKTLPEIMPASVAAMLSSPMTVSYWQVKEGTTNDFRFVSTVNFDALYAYDAVGYEVTVKAPNGKTIVDAEQKSTNTVYTSISAGNDTKAASELNAKYIVALSINGFKTEGEYTVTITPFVVCGETVIRDYDGTVTGTVAGNVFTKA